MRYDYDDLSVQTVRRVYCVDLADDAPWIETYVQDDDDGPCYPVTCRDPRYCGWIVVAETVEGSEFTLLQTLEGFHAAQEMVDRIDRHLAAGGKLNPSKWVWNRTIYGTNAWLQEFDDRHEQHCNAGGSSAEFMANN